MNTVYQYTESGLDNVQIHNMEQCMDDAGHLVHEIPNILGLHKVIALGIITSRAGLRPKEIRFLRTEMGMTQGELASLMQKDHQTVGRWERGETTVDSNAELIIRLLAAEKLQIDAEMSVEELARQCLQSAEIRMIEIDGADPEDYKLLAA